MKPSWVALSLCGLFLALGLALLPLPGIQNDEILFGTAIYAPQFVIPSGAILDGTVPLMIMDYLGALKAWIYKPIFRRWRPSLWSLRVPVLVLGTVTIWWFFLFVRHLAGDRTALVATALLAADTSYLLTTCFDWGPVVLQHLLLMGGLLALVRFHQSQRRLWLATGFLAFGLGLWDKALFGWSLGGLSVAALVTFPRLLGRSAKAGNLVVAVLAFTLGACPLLYFNYARRGETASRVRWSSQGIEGKVWVARATLDGSALFGYLVRDEPPVRGIRRSGNAWALLASVLLAPFWWRCQAAALIRFGCVFLLVAWSLMAFTENAGGSVHHTILLWPIPPLVIGVAVCAVLPRLAPWLAFGLALWSLMVTLQYRQQWILRGNTVIWTDAIAPLSEYIARHPAPRWYTLDWGMFDALFTLHRGVAPLWVGSDPGPEPSADVRREYSEMAALPEVRAVRHTAGNELFAGVNGRIDRLLEELGYRPEVVATIEDRHRRPVFEILRFRPHSTENRPNAAPNAR